MLAEGYLGLSIADWVKDWGGFEQLVAKLNETGDVTVEHDVTLPGRSGAPRQIDVLIRHKQGLYEHLVVAECKYWNSPVERIHVDALATTVREVGASRGVIFSTKGFQSGARVQAEHEAIDLFMVRDLTAEEWGLPGRVIDIILQIIQPGLGNFVFPGSMGVGVTSESKPANLELEFGAEGPISRTPLLPDSGCRYATLEELLYHAAKDALAKFMEKSFTINGGAECTQYMHGHVNLNIAPDKPLLVPYDNFILIIGKLEFDLGIKISQSRITIDRAQNYMFALAVENCVTGVCSAASRALDTDITMLSEMVTEQPDPSKGEVFKNGSVLRVFMKGFFDFAETSHLTPVDIDGLWRPLPRSGDGDQAEESSAPLPA